jgi:hypothetical protein
MKPDFFDPSPQEQIFGLVGEVLPRRKGMIESCEHCNPEEAEIPFDWILDRVTGSDPRVTDYILAEPANVRTVGVRSSKRHWSNRAVESAYYSCSTAA